MAERSAVNRNVVGSSPTWGATGAQTLFQCLGTFLCAANDFGSLSNVGVRTRGKQNPGPEGAAVSEAEDDAFEGFDGIVAALSKSVRQANVECI